MFEPEKEEPKPPQPQRPQPPEERILPLSDPCPEEEGQRRPSTDEDEPMFG
jgi:hypothetical protein